MAGPGFDTDLIPGDDAPIGPDGWYDVSPDGESGAAAPSSGVAASDPGAVNRGAEASEPIRTDIYIGLGLMALISAALAWLFWRRRKQEQAAPAADGPSLAFGVHKVIAETVPSVSEKAAEKDAAALREAAKDKAEPSSAPAPKPPVAPPLATKPATVEPPAAQPAPVPAPPPARPSPPAPPPVAKTPAPAPAPVNTQRDTPRDPARVDLGLEIVGGTRSLMMFTIDFRVDIANRADFAVRDLDVSARLVCAQSGEARSAPRSPGEPITKIERIGPQQSQRISGQMQLPLREVKAIQQGKKPLFIPMLHLIVQGSNMDILTRSFVIGTPSATSQTRVHPLPLDGPPGGLPSLRAQLIKHSAPA